MVVHVDNTLALAERCNQVLAPLHLKAPPLLLRSAAPTA
jgi:hypothetical protein